MGKSRKYSFPTGYNNTHTEHFYIDIYIEHLNTWLHINKIYKPFYVWHIRKWRGGNPCPTASASVLQVVQRRHAPVDEAHVLDLVCEEQQDRASASVLQAVHRRHAPVDEAHVLDLVCEEQQEHFFVVVQVSAVAPPVHTRAALRLPYAHPHTTSQGRQVCTQKQHAE